MLAHLNPLLNWVYRLYARPFLVKNAENWSGDLLALGGQDKVFMGITESRKSFSQSRQCSTDLNESFGFHLKLLVSL